MCLTAALFGPPGCTAEPAGKLHRLSEHLLVWQGPINVGVVLDGRKALLIDCGDGSVTRTLPDAGVTSIDQVLFTHHHRDQACGAHLLADHGARIVVPAAERGCFDNVGAYWNDPKNRWHQYYFHPHHLMLAEPIRVDAAVGDGDVLEWGPARISVLATPGHTDGSVSYLIEVDGRKVAFSGDLIYDHGQVWDLYSLQKGFRTEKREIRDYHGFLGSKAELVESLQRIRQSEACTLVPSHGQIMTDPPEAIDALVRQLEICHEKYAAISALRHYWPEVFAEYAGRDGHMPIRKGKPVPDCLRHFDTTWMILSETKAAFAMDCGSPRVIQEIRQLMDRGEVRAVEGLWVTHYHDDHMDAIPEFCKTFGCPCITDRAVAAVISDPLAWRLPCVSPHAIHVDRPTRHGESWSWHEFKMTAYNFPGQTLYHSGLLVEGRGLRMLFVGDSFTSAGIDDYCAYNRNWLGPNVGFDRCIALIDELQPTHIFNCHVADAFDFSSQDCRFMRANLAQRLKLFGQLLPWDHPNYGLDEQWVRCHPYEQSARPGQHVEFRVVVTNHSADPRTAACRAIPPRAWQQAENNSRPAPPAINPQTGDWTQFHLPAGNEGDLPITLTIPSDAPPGRYVIPVDLRYDTRTLPQFTEAIVVIPDATSR